MAGWLTRMRKLLDRFPAEGAPICTVQLTFRENCPTNGGVVDSRLDLSSLTLLSVPGCGRLQLAVAHWTTSVAVLQVVDNIIDPTNGGCRYSSGGCLHGQYRLYFYFTLTVFAILVYAPACMNKCYQADQHLLQSPSYYYTHLPA